MIISCIDAETVPSQSLPAGCLPEFDESEVATGNMGIEKAQAKIDKKRREFDEALDKKMATNPVFCQVCLFVGCVYDTDDGGSAFRVSQWTGEDNDYSVVYDAWTFVRHAFNERISLVTFNGKDFDLPVLFHRAMLLDIPVDQAMYTALTPKWNCDKFHYDLMKMLVGPYPERGRNLNFFLKLFQLGQKTEGVDGSKVYELWKGGEHDKIREYGKDDVKETAKLFARVAPWLVYQ